MWGRLASLGQNLQEFTKEVVNPTYESDEEQDEEKHQHENDATNSQPIIQQEESSTQQQHHSVSQHQIQQMIQQLEKKHQLELDQIGQQYQQQNILITKEYTRLLHDKEVEFTNLNKKLETREADLKQLEQQVEILKTKTNDQDQEITKYKHDELDLKMQMEKIRHQMEEKEAKWSQIENNFRRESQKKDQEIEKLKSSLNEAAKQQTQEPVSNINSSIPIDEIKTLICSTFELPVEDEKWSGFESNLKQILPDSSSQSISNSPTQSLSKLESELQKCVQDKRDFFVSLQELESLITNQKAKQLDPNQEDIPSSELLEYVNYLMDKFMDFSKEQTDLVFQQQQQVRLEKRNFEELERKFNLFSNTLQQISSKYVVNNNSNTDIVQIVKFFDEELRSKKLYQNTCILVIQIIDKLRQGNFQPFALDGKEVYDEIVVSKLKQLRETLQQLDTTTQQFSLRAKQLEQEYAQASHEKINKQKELEQLKQNVEKVHLEWTEQWNQKNLQVEQLEKMLQQQGNGIQEMRAAYENRLQALNEELYQTQMNSQQTQESLEEYNRRLAHVQKDNQMIQQKLQTELDEFKERDKKNRKQLDQQTTELEHLKKALQEKTNDLKERETALAKLEAVFEQLRGEIDRYEADIRKWKKRVEETKLFYESELTNQREQITKQVKEECREELEREKQEWIEKNTTPKTPERRADASQLLLTPSTPASHVTSFTKDSSSDSLKFQIEYLKRTLGDALARLNDENLVDKRIVFRFLLTLLDQEEGQRTASKVFDLLSSTLRLKDREKEDLRTLLKIYASRNGKSSDGKSWTSWFSLRRSHSPNISTATVPIGLIDRKMDNDEIMVQSSSLSEQWISFLMQEADNATAQQ